MLARFEAADPPNKLVYPALFICKTVAIAGFKSRKCIVLQLHETSNEVLILDSTHTDLVGQYFLQENILDKCPLIGEFVLFNSYTK